MPEDKTITLSQIRSSGTPARDITIPRELGPVRLIREIGRGGMGVVYLGRHGMLDRDVAVKFLLNAVAGTDDPGFKRFLAEGRAAAAVRHPALTVVYDADLIENVPYLVIEYVDGPTLSEIITRSGFLSLAATLAILDPVVHAISELHNKAIIHRDIKPSNVLLDADARVFVTDFGLACARPRARNDAATLSPAGTPAYMAPEMFGGTVSLQSDVYALGIMTFELLTGSLPFTGPPEQLREKHLHEPLSLESLRERRVDSALIEIVERATHKKAMFRFKRAEHFWRALQDTVATDELLKSGAADLRDSVYKLQERGPVEGPIETPEEPSTGTYFERLAELADTRRTTPKPPDQAEGSLEEALRSGTISRDRPTQTTTVEVDVPCVQCEYDLRSLSADGRCPECGEAVASSLRPDRLLFAEPSWLRHIMRGLTVLYAAVAATPVVLFLVAVGQLVLSSTGEVMARALAGAVAGVVLIVGVVLGSFFATAAEPRRAGESSRWSSRRVARTLGILVPLLLAAIPVTASYSRVLAIISLVLTWAALLGMIVTFLLYLASLADRIPMARLRTQARGLAIAIGVVQILGVGAGVVGFGLERTSPDSSWFMIVTSIICVLGSVLLAGLFWGLIRLYRKAIKQVIAASVSLDTLFGDIPTEVTLTSPEIKTSSINERKQRTLPTTEGTLQVDVPCAKCEYNLRGLSADGRCPECGEAVRASLRRDRLLFADPSWVGRIVLGQTLILAGTTIFWALLPFVPRNSRGSIAQVMLALSGIAMAGVIVAGVFLCTQRESARSNILRVRTTRWAARSLALLWLSGWSAAIALRWSGGVEYPVFVTLRVAAVSGLIVCFFLYIAALASRIPNQRLVKYSRGMTFIVCTFLLLWIARVVFLGESLPDATRIIRLPIPGTIPDWLDLSIFGLFLAAWLGMLIMGYWAVLRYRNAFNQVRAVTVPFDTLFGDVPN